MKTLLIILFWGLGSMMLSAQDAGWTADNGDGTFTNPLMWGDWPDPDVIWVGDDFYMVSTSMHYVPGCPIVRSKDLVNWTMAGYTVERYNEDPRYDMHGGELYLNGAWAATIRHHDGKLVLCGILHPLWLGTKEWQLFNVYLRPGGRALGKGYFS